MCHVVRTVRQSFLNPKHSQTDINRSRFNDKTFISQQELTQSGKVKVVIALFLPYLFTLPYLIGFKNLPAGFYRELETSGQSMCSNGRLAIETSIKNLIKYMYTCFSFFFFCCSSSFPPSPLIYFIFSHSWNLREDNLSVGNPTLK